LLPVLLFLQLSGGCTVRPLYDDGNRSGESPLEVDVIAERDGQLLRGFIQDSLRDLCFVQKKYRLSVKLAYEEKPFAFATDGNAKRLQQSYIAHVVLKDAGGKEVVAHEVRVFTSRNISTAQGEVLLLQYGQQNSTLLRELSARIVESLKMFVETENRER
jgi:hypothetical protein